MRVSNKMLYNSAVGNLQRNLEKLMDLQEEASSGKRINNPSDDPIGVMKLIDYSTALSKTEQYQRNIDNGVAFLTTTESVIDTAEDIIVRVKELSVTALNAGMSVEERASIAAEVEQLREQVLQMANTRYDNRHIFAGFNINTAPYNSDGSYTGTDSPDGYVEIETGTGSTVAINIPGYEVFGTPSYGTDILGTLSDFKTALENNDTQAIADSMSDLDSAMNQLIDARSVVGARINSLDTAKTYLSKLEVDIIGYKSNVEDADLAQVVTDLATQENLLEISKAAASAVLKQTLIDFLR